MSKRRPRTHQTRAARRRKDLFMRAGVWVFLVIFAFSVVGALFAVGTIR